jgi:hypothetical protein
MKKHLSLFTLLVSALLIFSSCYKEKEIKAVIIVTDEKEQAVAGADVFLHAYDANIPGHTDFERQTDRSGRVYFSFPLEAIYTIEVNKENLYGKNSIRLIAGETVEQTVVIR